MALNPTSQDKTGIVLANFDGTADAQNYPLGNKPEPSVDITDLAVTSKTATSVTLVWTGVNEVVAIERALSPGEFSEVQGSIAANSTEVTDSTVSESTEYHYRLTFASGSSNTVTVTTNASVSGDGFLPESYSTQSKAIPLSFVNAHPDDECLPRALHRNSYPGLPWDYVLAAHGGKWPYVYELVTAPTGMTLGEKLELDGSGTGRLVAGVDYERLKWIDPVAGSHTITVRCTDQSGAFVERTWTHICGTQNHAFIDRSAGDNANDGSINSPFADELALHGNNPEDSTYENYTVWVKGSGNLVGMTGANGRYRMGQGAPCVFRKWPGFSAEVVLTNTDYQVWTATSDVAFHGLTINHSENGWSASEEGRKFISVLAKTDRLIVDDLSSSYYTTGPTIGNNPALVTSINLDMKENWVFKNWDITGLTGTLYNLYWTQDSLYERIKVHDCTLRNTDASSNAQALRLKQQHYRTTTRGNEVFDNVVYDGISSAAGPHGTGVTNTNDYCYNKFWYPDVSGRKGAMRCYSNTTSEPVFDSHFYRNSLESVHWEGRDRITEFVSEFWTDNLVVEAGITNDPFNSGDLSEDPRVTLSNNSTGGSYFDSDYNLKAEFSAKRGLQGAEIFEEQQ